MTEAVPILPAYVRPRGLRFTDPQQARRYLSSLEGQAVDVIVFGVVVALLAEHCGYEPDEMHEVLAMRFLRIEDCPVTGAPRRRRTPKTNSKEFAAYVDQCIRLAAHEGIVVPPPDSVDVGWGRG